MYKAEIVNEGGPNFLVRSGNYEFTIGTEGSAITPPDTLLASLGSCMGVYIKRYLDGARISAGKFRVVLEAELDKNKPISFRKIKASIIFNEDKLDERRKEAMLEFIKNCPVHNTLKANPEVEVNISHL